MDSITKKLISLALAEDLGRIGDITSKAIFFGEKGRALLKCKSEAVLSGQEVFKEVFNKVDKRTSVKFFVADGKLLAAGTVAAEVAGKIKSILLAERTALNFLCFLSGIATQTRTFVQEASRYGKTLVLDTRKTLPGLRLLSKQAVCAGGGFNHRQGLYDMILIKDNHIDAAGSLSEAVQRVRQRWHKRYKIEVECRSLEDVKEALKLGVDRIMLDNMQKDQLIACLQEIAGKIETEISGGIKLDDLKEIVPLRPSYISVGSLTHSVKSADFSLEIIKES